MNTGDDLQKRIMGEISACRNITVGALPKKLRMRPNVVLYQLNRLLQCEVLQRTVFIGQGMLEFQTLCFLLDLRSKNEKATNKSEIKTNMRAMSR